MTDLEAALARIESKLDTIQRQTTELLQLLTGRP